MAAQIQINNLQDPIRVLVRMERDEPPVSGEETTQDRVKKVVACFLITIGLMLVSGAFCMLSGNAMGLVSIETATAQTLFICGLSGLLGGFSLQNANYKGSLSIAPTGLPFSLKLEQK